MKKLMASILLFFGLLFGASTTHAQEVEDLKSLMLKYGATSKIDSSLVNVIGSITYTTKIPYGENLFVIDEIFWIGNGSQEIERVGLVKERGMPVDVISFYKGRIICSAGERGPTIAELRQGETPFDKDLDFLKNWVTKWMYNLTLLYKQ